MNVHNFIDLHVHIGPEVLPRKYTVGRIIKEQRRKIAGIALKSHFYPTTPLIKSEEDSDLILVGSVTLNNYLGGLNPDLIYSSATLASTPIIVWFPTINAENFLKRSKYEIPPEWVGKGFESRLSKEVRGIRILKDNGKLTTETVRVLKAIKENNCILATGHLSWEETKVLTETAVKMGIKKIIITHPIYQRIAMPLEIQKELASFEGVFVEQSYSMYFIDGISIKEIAAQIKAINPAKCILVSDLGQINNPSPSEGLQDFTTLLIKEGITEEELRVMGEFNPRKLLGLPQKNI